MKPSRRNLLLSLVLLGNAQAATLYWDGSNGSWLNSSSWSTDPNNTTPDPAGYPDSPDNAVFNVSSVNGATNVTFNQNHLANSLTFNNTGATNLVTDGVANRALSVGAGGMTMAAGAGTATIGSATNLFNIPITFTASQTWINNSANNLVIANNFTTSAGVNITKQGTGNVWMSNTANNTVIAGNLDIQAGKFLVSGDTTWNGVLSGAGNLENGGPSGKWVFQQGAGDSTFSGSIKDKDASTRLGLVKRNNDGTLTLSGTNQLGDRLAAERGAIRITGTTVAGVSGTANAQVLAGNSTSNGKILIDGGTLTCFKNSSPTFIIGGTAAGAGQVKMTTGSITTSNQYNLGNGAGAYAAHTQSGGSLSSGNWLVVGANNDRGVLNQSGGSITVTSNRMTVGAGGAGSIGVCNFSGGTFTSNAGTFIGENGTGTLNISGTHSYTTGTNSTQFAGNASSLAAYINLMGGTLATGSVTKGSSTGTGVYRFAFEGGTLKANTNSTSFFADLALTDAYVYSGGGTINNNAFNITLGEALKAPTGNGVSSTGLTVSGGGYIDTPLVTVTGGGGTGATAVANIDGSGNLTGITMTCPGIGYTSAPTFALLGGGVGNTGAIGGAATLVANTSGAMTFTGTGTTTITSAMSYTGGTTVNAGKLVLNLPTSSVGAFTVADNAALGVTPSVKNNSTTVSSLIMGSTGNTTLETNFGDQTGVNSTTAPLTATNISLNGTSTINVTGTKFAVGTLPLVAYTSKTGSFALGTLPSGVVATLNDSGSLVSLNITSVALPRWNGDVNSTWDIGTTANWVDQVSTLASTYANPNPVLFDDAATGTTNVTLNSTVAPSEVVFNNTTAKAYTLTGSGKITGSTGLVKKNTGTATITTLLNDNTGVTRIEGGVLSVDTLANGGAASSIGAATGTANNLVFAGGTLTYTGANVSIDRGFKIEAASSINTANNLAFGGNVTSIGGSLTKLGAGTLSFTATGTNTFGTNAAPAIRVDNGTLTFDGSAGSQTNQVNNEIWTSNVVDTPANLNVTNTTLNLVSWLALSRGSGNLGGGTFTMSNSTVNVGNFSVGFSNGNTANSSNTTVTQTGTTFTNTGTTHIAESPGAIVNWTLQSGSAYNATGANLNIAGGGTGGSGTATATVTLKDTSSITKTGTGAMQLGNAGGAATLNLEDNSTLSVPALEFYIANSGASVATVNVKNNATASFGATVFVGKSDTAGTGTSNGSLVQTGGTVNAASWLVVGRYPGATGTYNISAGTVNQTATVGGTAMIIGEQGTGTLNISGTGAVNVNGTFLSIAKVSGGTGTVNLNGGSLSARRVIEETNVGTSTFNFNGGVLKALENATDFLSVDTANVNAGGAIFDTNGFNVTVLEPLAGSGSLTKQGAGTLTLNTTLTYSGSTTVNAGTLSLGASGSLPVTGDLTINSSTFDVRNGTANRFSEVNNLTLNNSTLIFEGNGTANDTLSVAGTVSATGSQTVKITGNLTPGTYTLISSPAALPGTYTLDTTGMTAGFYNYSGHLANGNKDYVVTVTGATTPSDAYWHGDVSSVWSDASSSPNSNWATSATGGTDTAQIPGISTNVYFQTNSATNTTTTLGTNFSIKSLTFSTGTSSIGGANTLNIDDFNTNAYALEVANGATASIGLGTVTYLGDTKINTGGTLTVTGGSLGSTTIGDFIVDGTLNVNSLLTKGALSGSGTVTRSIAGLGILTVGGSMDSTFSGLIQDGSGSVRLTKAGATQLLLATANTHSGGTSLVAGSLQLGNAGAIGTGTLTLSGGILDNNTGSPLSLSNTVSLGGAWEFIGTDSLTFTGAVSSTSQPTVRVDASNLNLPNGVSGSFGLVKTGPGTLNLTGNVTSATTNATGVISFADGVTNYPSGTLQSTGAEIWVGNDPGNNGVFNMTGGTVNAVNWIAVGRSGGSGTLNMSAGTITKTTTTGNITISGGTASGQSGTVNQSGGTVTNTDSQTWVGESGTGTYTLSNTGVANLGLINLGRNDSTVAIGTFNLDGGTLSTTQIIKGGATATGTFNFNGGTMVANTGAVGATFMTGLSAANVRNGGAIINTNSQNITIGQALQHSAIGGDNAIDGGLVKNGAGVLTLGGTNTYTGNTTVNAGTLSVANPSLADTSTVNIASGATLNLSHAATDTVTSLIIGGVTQADGVYGAIGSGAAHETSAITGTGKLQVGANGYSAWASANAGGQTADLDFDNDGVENGVEYFMGQTGSSFTTNPAVVSGAITWPKSATFSGTYRVETSTDLVIWTDVTGSAVDNGTSVTYTLPTGNPKQFVHLVVIPN